MTNTRPRSWLRLAPLGILCTALSAAHGASGAGRATSAQMLPPDTVLILHADLAALRQSALYNRLTGPMSPSGLLKGPLQSAVFDLERDIDAVTLGMASDMSSLYVVLHGRFPRGAFETLARASGAFSEEALDGLSVFRTPRGKAGAGGLSTYAMLGEDTLLVAADHHFGALLASARGHGPNAAGAPLLRDLLGRASHGQISLDMRFTAPARQRVGAAAPWGPMAELEALESLQVGVSFGQNLEIFARGGTAGHESSQRLFESALGWLTIGRMLLGSEPLGTALNKFRIDREGADLKLTVSLTPEEAEMLLR
jgi:hypothetical protein